MTKDDIIRIETALKIAYEIGFENGKKAQPEQEPVAFAAEILEDVNGVLSTRWADWWIPNEGDKLYTTPPAAPKQEPCIGKDPRCPCQDGDACHYKDCGSTKALPVPVAQPEQEPVAWAVQGCSKMWRDEFAEIDAKAEAKRIGGTCVAYALYTTTPAAQRKWVGLTDEDWAKIEDMPDAFDQGVAWAAARLKERNNGH